MGKQLEREPSAPNGGWGDSRQIQFFVNNFGISASFLGRYFYDNKRFGPIVDEFVSFFGLGIEYCAN